jgi:dTMP kinase
LKQRGRFISIEGGEGAGKSSNIAVIRARLQEAGKTVVVTREPGGTPLAEEIRALLLAQRSEPMCSATELLLVFAARAQHVQAVILPALERGDWVLSDRFSDATLAYQGAGRGMDASAIDTLSRLVLHGFKPDLTILLDLPVACGMQRAAGRGAPDRFESEEWAFFERVRSSYLDMAAREPVRIRRVDASVSLPDVERAVIALVNEFLHAHG